MNKPIWPIDECPRKSGLNFTRGLGAALCLGAIGFTTPILMLWLLVNARWIIEGANEWERPGNIGMFFGAFIHMAFGIMAVLAAAGWATFAPRNRNRFASTLVMVFAASLVGWTVLGSMELTPQRPKKTVQQVLIYPSEFMVLVVPPVIAGFLISAIRRPLTAANWRPA